MPDFKEGDRVYVRSPFRRGFGTVLYAAVGGAYRVKLESTGQSRRVEGRYLRLVERTVTPPPGVVRLPLYTEAPAVAPVPKAGPGRHPRYLAWIRLRPCAWTGSVVSVEASHHPRPGHGSMALKTSDWRTLPLCSSVHRHYHQHGSIGSMTPEQSRAWVEEQIVEHLIRYLEERE